GEEVVVLDRVPAENEAEVPPEPVHWSLVAKVLGGVCHQKSDGQDEQLLPTRLAHASGGEEDNRHPAGSGESKMQPARVPAPNVLGSILRPKLSSRRNFVDHSPLLARQGRTCRLVRRRTIAAEQSLQLLCPRWARRGGFAGFRRGDEDAGGIG